MRRRLFLVLLATASCKAKPFACDDVSQLAAADVKNRSDFAYTDHAPESSKTCASCLQFVAAKEGCGSCNLLKGPVHPGGWCKAFSAKG